MDQISPPRIRQAYPFERLHWGYQISRLHPHMEIRTFHAVDDADGRPFTLQSRRPGDTTWHTAQTFRALSPGIAGGHSVLTGSSEPSEVTYRLFIPADDVRPEVVSGTHTIHFDNPSRYTGRQAEAYAVIAPHVGEMVTISITDEPIQGVMGGGHTLAMAYPSHDHLRVSSQLFSGPDVRSTLLHEAGHLIQHRYYPNATAATAVATAIYGKRLPLERSANCLMQAWGGLAEGNAFPYCKEENSPGTTAYIAALQDGRPYYPPGFPLPD